MCNVCIAKRRLEDERNIQLFVANANCSLTLRHNIVSRKQLTSESLMFFFELRELMQERVHMKFSSKREE